MTDTKRPDVIQGVTYKIKPPIINDAVYITINDSKINGIIRPVEIFINSKDMKSFQWISLITRLLSSILLNSEKFPEFVINEMIETYDPGGDYIIPKSGGKKVNSIVAHIGIVLEKHCINLDLI